MFPATTKAGGQCFALPDTCKVPAPPGPPVPTPFPNTAMCTSMQATSTKVLIENKDVATLDSKMPTSTGDEAGSLGGTVSGMIKGEVGYKKGSAKVKIEGKAVVFLTSTTGHNGTNANAPNGAQIAPSQAKVLIGS
jgi:hypothetical protein